MGLFDWLFGKTDETDEKLLQTEEDAKIAARAEDKRRAAERNPKKEEKKQNKWQNPNEMIKFVCMGGKAICPFTPAPGDIVVTSTQVKLQDKFWATSADRNGAPKPNILFKGVCTLLKWGSNQPPCASVIQLGNWENVSETRIDNFQALLRKSTVKCLQSGQDIIITFSGQKAFIEAAEPQTTPPKPPPPGYYYTEQGVFLGKILHHEDVYITDPATFESMKKRQPWSEANVIAFTEKYHLTNTELLDRANWVYGEGGGNFPDHYAHAIKNLKEHGVWGPANKPFASDKLMYAYKMTHQETIVNEKGEKVKKIINLYPGYFDGTAGSPSARAFAKARINPEELNKLNPPKANDAIKAVIGSIMGTTKDPTNGCYQWVGGKGAEGGIAKNPTLNNATGIVNVTADGRYHTFYKILKE